MSKSDRISYRQTLARTKRIKLAIALCVITVIPLSVISWIQIIQSQETLLPLNAIATMAIALGLLLVIKHSYRSGSLFIMAGGILALNTGLGVIALISGFLNYKANVAPEPRRVEFDMTSDKCVICGGQTQSRTYIDLNERYCRRCKSLWRSLPSNAFKAFIGHLDVDDGSIKVEFVADYPPEYLGRVFTFTDNLEEYRNICSEIREGEKIVAAGGYAEGQFSPYYFSTIGRSQREWTMPYVNFPGRTLTEDLMGRKMVHVPDPSLVAAMFKAEDAISEYRRSRSR